MTNGHRLLAPARSLIYAGHVGGGEGEGREEKGEEREGEERGRRGRERRRKNRSLKIKLGPTTYSIVILSNESQIPLITADL